jgi:hypothetical protein
MGHFAAPLTIALSHKERGDGDMVYPAWGEGSVFTEEFIIKTTFLLFPSLKVVSQW